MVTFALFADSCGELCFWKVSFIRLSFKGLVHPKMKILSVFTHPRVVPNLFIFSAINKGRYLEECFNQTDLIPHW